MIRLNNKGFMMAEVVVVSAIVLTFLTVIFTSYNKIYATYRERISYYDTVTLYRLAYYRDNLIETEVEDETLKNKMNEYIKNTDNVAKITADVIEGDTVIMINNNKGPISSANVNDIDDIHKTFKDYLDYLTTAVGLNSNYVMVMERCGSDTNNCKYAYLEIYDGKE